jgi:protein-tyrosine phosphatase
MRRCFTLKEFVRLAEGGVDEVRGGEGAATAYEGAADGKSPLLVDGFDVAVAAVTGRRGAAAPVPPAEDDVADPWGRPHAVLYRCAHEIDGAVSTLARLLGGGASV